tara:strand:- start:8950 stop:9720 length:771 start_codon:yes stop_codon:yes gene_type:complete
MKKQKDLDISLKTHTAYIKINRPPHNYFDSHLISQIANFLEEMDKNNNCRSIILCSEGKNFCAGANFYESTFSKGGNVYSNLYKQALRLFETKKPIIAIIQGAAIGGGLGLALAADFRIACEESRFSANFAKLGFHHGFGTTITLPKVIGYQKAKLMLLTSIRIKGKEALEIGLADYFVDKNKLMDKATELSNLINTSGPLGIESIRNTINQGLVEEISKSVIREASEQNRLKDTQDFKEGIKASMDRREPNFKRK